MQFSVKNLIVLTGLHRFNGLTIKFKVFAGFCFFLNVATLSAQVDTPDSNQIKLPGISIVSFSTSDDIANSIMLGRDGSMFISGYTNSRLTLFKLRPAGDVDSTFGNHGAVIAPLMSGQDLSSSVLLLPQNKILVSGSAYNGKSNDFVMLRYMPQGTPDSTFGMNGVIRHPVRGGNDISSSMAMQTDGKIIIVGSSNDGRYDVFAMARINPDGKLDSIFGNKGFVVTDIQDGDDRVSDMAIQTDGKILVTGVSNTEISVARFLAKGQLDRSFGNNGIVLVSVNQTEDIAKAIVLQDDGKIVVAVSSFNGDNFDFALVRLTTSGKLDPSFGKGGMVITNLGLGDDKIFDLAIQTDGKFVAGGSSFNGQSDDFALVRYNTDGSLDNTFGHNGQVVMAVQKGDEHIYSLAIQPDKKIVAAGNTNNGFNNDFIVLRFRTDGTPDPDFGR